MSDVLRAIVIGTALVAVIAIIVSLPVFGLFDDIFKDDGAISQLTYAISLMTPYLVSGRMLLNNFVNPTAFSIMISFGLTLWLVWGSIKVGMFIVNLLHK